MVRELVDRGHEAIPVTLPAGDERAGWSQYADAIVAAAADRRGLVIVGQSLGGFSAPIAAARLNASRIVLVNAMIPLPGETGSEWWSDTGSGEAHHEHLRSLGIAPETADDDVIYFHDTPPDLLTEIRRRPEPEQSMTPMEQPWPLDAWPDIPTRVLTGRDDRLFPADFQRRIARERLGLDVELLPGGHLLAWSHPGELADKLVEGLTAA